MGVTEFYRARTETKMTIAAERLAVIAVMTLPVTALSSVVGMNVIVNEDALAAVDHPTCRHAVTVADPPAMGQETGMVVSRVPLARPSCRRRGTDGNSRDLDRERLVRRLSGTPRP